MKKIYKRNESAVYVFIVFYFLINLLFLDSFPFVHSDEAWLASLTRAIVCEKSFSAVEDFFLLTERHPHALKTVFHIMQIPFVSMSFSAGSVRLLSLFFSLINLLIFYRLLSKNIRNRKIVFLTTLILAADIQYLYISRFARQEIIIMTVMTAVLYLLSNTDEASLKKTAAAAVLTGTAVSIHPNSFIIFTAAVFLMAGMTAVRPACCRNYLKSLILYISITALFALVFLLVSLIMDNNFFKNYLEFGSKHGVSDIFIIKIFKLKRFYFKMFNRISGTYFLPDVRFQLTLFALSSAVLLLFAIFSAENRKKVIPVLFFAAGINTGLLIIGKYSPPSFAFIFPSGWLITALAADSSRIKNRITEKSAVILFALFLSFTLFNSYNEISEWTGCSYKRYMGNLSRVIEKEGRVFGPVNTAFYMKYGRLASYNDIEQFEEYGKSFKEYIEEFNIRYIIYSDELDIIYRERPLWNDLYGNIYPYYTEIKNFLDNYCIKRGEVYDSIYPVRIVDYMGREKYSVKIYEVK